MSNIFKLPRIFVLVMTVISASMTVAQTTPPSVPTSELLTLALTDTAGVAVTGLAASLTDRTVVLVIDANRPLSFSLLSKLRALNIDWKNRLLVIVQGSVAETKVLMNGTNLRGVRWAAITSSAAARGFKVAGAPFVVMLSKDGISANKIMGEPQITDNNFSKLRGWIEPNSPNAPSK